MIQAIARGRFVYAIVELPWPRRRPRKPHTNVKFGICRNRPDRLKRLQTANPNRLHIKAFAWSPEAELCEDLIHQQLRDDRIRTDGEWFRRTDRSELMIKTLRLASLWHVDIRKLLFDWPKLVVGDNGVALPLRPVVRATEDLPLSLRMESWCPAFVKPWPDAHPWLEAKEVADLVGIPRDVIVKEAIAGRLRAARTSRKHWVLNREWVTQWLEARQRRIERNLRPEARP